MGALSYRRTNEPPKRRRWFQFRLRTLLIAILLLSLPLSWFAVRLNKVRKQELTIKEIYRLGGVVSCELEIVDPNKEYRPPTERIRDVLRDVFSVKPIQILLLKKFDHNDSSSTLQKIEICDDASAETSR